MNPHPFVSIIVRTYNRPQRLRECLKFIDRQDYQPIEVIVVNDAGEDVEEIITDTLGTRPFRSIRNAANLGRTAGLNIGVEAASGDYLNFVDDDDCIYPHHIRTLVEAAVPDQAPVVYSDVINVTYAMDSQTHEWKRIKEQLVYSFDFERDNFLLANYIPLTCLLFRRDCFDRVGPFDESLTTYEDWEFLIRLSRIFTFRHIRTTTGEYRRWDDNSNILEKASYQTNEAIVKRRYREERNQVFDEIFKRTFKQKRELSQQMAQFDRVLKQTNVLQSQVVDAHKVIMNLQQELAQRRGEGVQ